MGGEIGLLFYSGFDSSLIENKLPTTKFINYQKTFSKHNYLIGERTNLPLDIFHGFGTAFSYKQTAS